VVALDRLGRSLSHMLATIEDLDRRGTNLVGIREAIDFSTPTGRPQAALFGVMAEYERELSDRELSDNGPKGHARLPRCEGVRSADVVASATHRSRRPRPCAPRA
jgi:hypothetical protein